MLKEERGGKEGRWSEEKFVNKVKKNKGVK